MEISSTVPNKALHWLHSLTYHRDQNIKTLPLHDNILNFI